MIGSWKAEIGEIMGWRKVKPYATTLLVLLIFVYLYVIYELTSYQLSTKLFDKVTDGELVARVDIQNNQAPQPKTFWDQLIDDGNFENVTILLWTTYYGNKDLTDHIQRDSPVPDWCTVTFDRSLFNESGALVFSMVPNDFTLDDLPPRDPSQLWTYFLIEPPSYHSRDANVINGIFNRTMSYRLDSDYPCPYGYVVKREQVLPENPYYSNHLKKDKLIVWMVSHCSSTSNREEVVEEMRQAGLSIDVYGSCGTFDCDKDKEIECYQRLGKEYKFYLSFENSICRDYITEKFSNALLGDLVPIVYGAGDYDSILPSYPSPGYINVKDYKYPEDLAQYLLYLDKNDTAYAEYFQWKRFYNVKVRQGFSGFAKICYDLQRTQTKKAEPRVYEDLHKWWVKDAKCAYDWPNFWE